MYRQAQKTKTRHRRYNRPGRHIGDQECTVEQVRLGDQGNLGDQEDMNHARKLPGRHSQTGNHRHIQESWTKAHRRPQKTRQPQKPKKTIYLVDYTHIGDQVSTGHQDKTQETRETQETKRLGRHRIPSIQSGRPSIIITYRRLGKHSRRSQVSIGKVKRLQGNLGDQADMNHAEEVTRQAGDHIGLAIVLSFL